MPVLEVLELKIIKTINLVLQAVTNIFKAEILSKISLKSKLEKKTKLQSASIQVACTGTSENVSLVHHY